MSVTFPVSGDGAAAWAAARPGTSKAAATDSERMDLRIENPLRVLVDKNCPTILSISCARAFPSVCQRLDSLLANGSEGSAQRRCTIKPSSPEIGAGAVIFSSHDR